MIFIDSVDDIYLSTFKILEDKIKNEHDFLIYLLSSNIDIPLKNYKQFLENSNNKIIKTRFN